MSADFTFFAGTTGQRLDFVVPDPVGVLLSNPGSASVTWIAPDGRRRTLTLTNAVSSLFTYTLSLGDYPGARYERGQLLVSIGTSSYWLSGFTLHVLPHV